MKSKCKYEIGGDDPKNKNKVNLNLPAQPQVPVMSVHPYVYTDNFKPNVGADLQFQITPRLNLSTGMNTSGQNNVGLTYKFAKGGKKYAAGGANPPTFEEWLQQTGQELIQGSEGQLYQQYQNYINGLDQSSSNSQTPAFHPDQDFNDELQKANDFHADQTQPQGRLGTHVTITKDPNHLDFSSGFKLFNNALDLTSLIAGKVNSIKADRKEKYDFAKAQIQSQVRNNPYEDGLNNVPIVYEKGGLTANKAREILHDGTVHGHPITDQQRRFFGAKSKGNTMQYKMGGSDMEDTTGMFYKTGGGKWIPANLHKGRCTPGSPNYDCPEGSPQWNLAQTFKKHHGFHKMQDGGQPEEVEGTEIPGQTDELEKGEVFQQNDGGIKKVSEDEPRHEQGGSDQPFVFRVLEDTSDKRKDSDSQALKVYPTDAMSVAGVKTSKELSHSKLYEKATEGTSKTLKKIQTDLKNAIDYLKLSKDKYGRATIDENMRSLANLPSNGELFDNIFNHQESVKAKYGIGNNDNTNKFGGHIFEDGGDNGKKKSYNPNLAANDAAFQEWYKQNTPEGKNNIPFSDKSDYDYYSYYRNGDYKNYQGGHFPDTYKMPNHATFSNQSIYSTPENTGGSWNGNQFVPAAPNIVTPYAGGKTAAGATTPTGVGNAFSFKGGLPAYQSAWQTAGVDLTGAKTNAEAQSQIYDNLLKNNPEAIRQMWKKYGNTAAGIKAGLPKTLDDNYLADPANLQKLKAAYTDNMFGVRTLMPQRGNITITSPGTSQFTDPASPAVPPVNGKYSSNSQMAKAATSSQFNEPLRWYDVAGGIMGLKDNAERIPVPLEQLDRPDLRYREQSPLPTIQQGQEDFSAMVGMLPQNSIGFANTANLYSRKYSLNNQTFGQYENINKSGYNNTDNQNNLNRFQLDQTNLGLRDQQQQRILEGKAIQQANKEKSFGNLMQTIAQNAALNRNGNLAMQMTPYFNQFGQFNGNKFNVAPTGTGQAKPIGYKCQLNAQGKYDLVPIYG